MIYQSNLFQNTIGLQHYLPRDERSFSLKCLSNFLSFVFLFKAKLAFLLLILTFQFSFPVQLNADDKSGIRKSGSISQNCQTD